MHGGSRTKYVGLLTGLQCGCVWRGGVLTKCVALQPPNNLQKGNFDTFVVPGYVAGFPNTYAEKVGKTSDAMYKGTVQD